MVINFASLLKRLFEPVVKSEDVYKRQILRWDTNTLVKYGDDWYVVSGGVVAVSYTHLALGRQALVTLVGGYYDLT